MTLARRPLVAFATLVALAALAAAPSRAGAIGRERSGDFKAEYLFNFATSAGTLKQGFQGLTYDAVGNELYVVNNGLVRVFNAAGVEVFAFGEEAEFGGTIAAAPLESGDILLLATSSTEWWLLRTSFRGELKARFSPTGIPADFPMKEFHPVAMRYAKGKLFLADKGGMRVLVLDPDGTYVTSHDLAALIDAEDSRADLGVRGFNVDREGNLLFTISPEFKAYVLSPGGELRAFGRSGSSPGRFGVVAGIATDEEGRFYVTDILRCQIIVFDKNFEFLGEFGGRGWDPENVIGPIEVQVANGKAYVVQGARRGVSVFAVTPG